MVLTHVPTTNKSGPMELDSHADTCCAGSNCVIVEYTNKTCNVDGFNRETPNDELMGIPIVKAATAYDAPTGETFIIILSQALFLGDHISYSLLCPNQLRHNGLTVDDVPRHLSPNPDLATYSIFIPDENVSIPLELRGIISLFITCQPSPEELENCRWLMFTSELEWHPHSEDFMRNEMALSLTGPATDRTLLTLNSSIFPKWECETDTILSSISSAYSQGHLNCSISLCPVYTYAQMYNVSSQITSQRQGNITNEKLSELWGISLKTAEQTLRITTQKGIKNAIHPIIRRYATKQSRLRYNQLGSRHGRFYSDTFFASVSSTCGNNMVQLFVNDIKYLCTYPMQKKSEAGSALLELIQDIGIPLAIHTDGAKELSMGKWKTVCSDFGIKQTITEPYSPWQNQAELNIREAKKKIHLLMSRTNTPKCLWDYCASYVADITCLTANDIYVLHGRTPHEMVTGNTPDITEYVEFSWYQPIIYYEDLLFPDTKRKIARWLGVAHRVGQALCYWLLANSGQVIARTTVQQLTDDELLSPVIQQEIRDFDLQVSQVLASDTFWNSDSSFDDIFSNDVYGQECVEPYDPSAEMPNQNEFPDYDSYDQYISAQVLLPRGDSYEKGTVIRRK
jgi:hypothetical protein